MVYVGERFVANFTDNEKNTRLFTLCITDKYNGIVNVCEMQPFYDTYDSYSVIMAQSIRQSSQKPLSRKHQISKCTYKSIYKALLTFASNPENAFNTVSEAIQSLEQGE